MSHHFYGTESQPYSNILGNKFSNFDARSGASASPLLSQPALIMTQRSAAPGLHNSGSQPSVSQLGPLSQQQGLSGHARSSGLCHTPNQPALSGVFRPGSAPHAELSMHRPSSSQMDLTASQWSQQPAGNMLGITSSMQAPSGLAGNPNHLSSGPAGHHHAAGGPSSSSLLRPKPLPLLRVPGGGASSLASQLQQHRPGSAPGLLTGAPAGMQQQQQQQSLLGMSHRGQQQQQQRGLSGLGLASSSSQQQQGLGLLSGSQPPQQLDLLGHASQGAGNLGFGDYDSAATEPPASLLGSQQQHALQLLPLGDAGRGRDGAGAAVLQGTEQSQLQSHHQQWRQRPSTAAASPARPHAAAAARTADDSAAAAAASPAATAAAGADLAQRISSLQECCSCMNKIITQDIPALLQQQASTQDSLQELTKNSSREHSALEDRMTTLADSVASFMDGFQAWQQEQQQRQERRDAEQQQRQQVVLSNMACQTTPSIAGGKPAGHSLQEAAKAAATAAAAAKAAVHAPAHVGAAAVISPARTRYARHSSSMQQHGSTAKTPAAAADPEQPSPLPGDAPFGGYAAQTAARVALQFAAPSPEKGLAAAAAAPPAMGPGGAAASGRGRGHRSLPAAPASGRSKQTPSLVQSKLNFCKKQAAADPAACAGRAAAAGTACADDEGAAAEPAEQQTPWHTKHSSGSNSSAKKQAAAASGGSVAAAASGMLAGSASQGAKAAAAARPMSAPRQFGLQHQQQVPPAAPCQFQRRANSTTASAAAGSAWQGAASRAPSQSAAAGAGVVASRINSAAAAAVSKPARRTASAAAPAARATTSAVPRRPASARISTRAAKAAAAAAGAAAAGASAAVVAKPIAARPQTAKRSRPQTAKPAPAAPPAPARPADSAALMLFGEMDSDSLDDVEGEEEEQQQPPYGRAAAGAVSFGMLGGDFPAHGVFGAGRAVHTAASGAGAVRGRAPASVPASSWLAGSQRPAGKQQQQQQAGSGALVDDDELARQVAAHMARHRIKRMRASQSCMG